MQQATAQTSKAYLNFLTILHAALLGTQLLVAIAFYYIDETNPIASAETKNLDEIFQFIIPAFLVASYIGSTMFVKNQLKALQAKETLREKLSGYTALLLIKLALLEVPSLFALVCFLLTSSYLYFALAGLIMLVFLLNRPTPSRIVNDLELSPTDRTILENPDALLS
jgi:hypothetical protein